MITAEPYSRWRRRYTSALAACVLPFGALAFMGGLTLLGQATFSEAVWQVVGWAAIAMLIFCVPTTLRIRSQRPGDPHQ